MLVDDHAAFREPLGFIMEREPDLVVVAQAGCLADAGQVLSDGTVEVDVAVVDLDLPDGTGSSFVDHLRQARSEAMALVLSAYSDRAQIAEAIEAGAAGVMHKSVRPREIIDAVRRLRAGEHLLSSNEIVEAVRTLGRERRRNRKARAKIESLTPRERDVLQVLAEGCSDGEISEKLYLSAGTVRVHVTNIMRKLDAHSRLQAVVFAVRHGAAKIE